MNYIFFLLWTCSLLWCSVFGLISGSFMCMDVPDSGFNSKCDDWHRACHAKSPADSCPTLCVVIMTNSLYPLLIWIALINFALGRYLCRPPYYEISLWQSWLSYCKLLPAGHHFLINLNVQRSMLARRSAGHGLMLYLSKRPTNVIIKQTLWLLLVPASAKLIIYKRSLFLLASQPLWSQAILIGRLLGRTGDYSQG